MVVRSARFHGPDSGWRQEVAQHLSKALAWSLQRLPFASHFVVTLLGILGPLLAPRLVSVVTVGIHLVFIMCQTRLALAMYWCYRGVREHSMTDWAEQYERERSELEKRVGTQDTLDWRVVQHCILVPAYKEDVSTLKETLDILASHPLAPTNYNICLGMEEREAGARTKAQSIIDSYRSKNSFAFIDFSIHPGNIVGESAGKSSNVNWAARYIAGRMAEERHSECILTVMDADTAFAADFFLACAVHFALATPEERQRMMFVPPIVFDRNCPEVPVFTRTTDIFWSSAGIGGIYPSSQCKIPTSAYGVSLKLAQFCGYWDAGPEAIGEDLHFYCKALFETQGNLKAVTVYSPASHCNVVGAPAGGPIAGYLSDMRARWTQACRHLWGSLDWGYSWHRTLTGAFGPSRRNAAAYMEIVPDRNDFDDDDVYSIDVVAMDPALLPPTFEPDERRTPSPTTTSSTSYSTDDTLADNHARPFKKVGHMDQPHAPAPVHAKVHFDDEDHEAEAYEVGDKQEDRPFLVDETLVDDTANPARRWFRIVVLLTRLYEAHLMVAHLFLIMFVLTLFPAVVHRNGNISIWEPWGRHCTIAKCLHAIEVTPFAATADLPTDLPPGMQPFWMMPDIVMCAIRVARVLGFFAIMATVVMCIMHDYYHQEAASLRWSRSEAVLNQWHKEGSVGPLPARYLGRRATQVSHRKWPLALWDYAAIPAGLLYGVLPLLYAQLNHLTTNKMNYVVSAKGKKVVVPVTTEVLRRSMDASRSSAGLHRPSLSQSRRRAGEAALSGSCSRGGAGGGGKAGSGIAPRDSSSLPRLSIDIELAAPQEAADMGLQESSERLEMQTFSLHTRPPTSAPAADAATQRARTRM